MQDNRADKGDGCLLPGQRFTLRQARRQRQQRRQGGVKHTQQQQQTLCL